MVERQELYCHECTKYVQFDMDLSLNGNHVLTCPVCGHEHCRVVDNGRITDIRWDSRNQSYCIQTSTISVTSASTYTYYNNTPAVSTTNTVFLYGSWMNTTTRS